MTESQFGWLVRNAPYLYLVVWGGILWLNWQRIRRSWVSALVMVVALGLLVVGLVLPATP